MSQSMSLARDNVTNCTVCDDADLHHWREGQDITTRLLRAIATAISGGAGSLHPLVYRQHPNPASGCPRVDVGMAVDTGDGLVVPAIRDVGNRTAAELRQDIDRSGGAARERTR